MGTDRIHRVASGDGTEIVGRLDGQGPPLVLVHGSLEDGDLCWGAMLPYLRRRFTCYLPSTRSRGLSGDSADLTPERRVEDVVSFVRSIDEPVYVFGESDGGALTLAAAARSDAVSAVAAYEPVVFEAADEDLVASLKSTIPQVGRAVNDGRLGDAARIFSELVANDDELATLSKSGYFDEAGPYMPIFLQELEQASQSESPGPTDPSLLSNVSAPVLLLRGSRSKLREWFRRGVSHVAEHVAESEVHEVPGAGHFAVVLEPETIANELTRFFTTEPTPGLTTNADTPGR